MSSAGHGFGGLEGLLGLGERSEGLEGIRLSFSTLTSHPIPIHLPMAPLDCDCDSSSCSISSRIQSRKNTAFPGLWTGRRRPHPDSSRIQSNEKHGFSWILDWTDDSLSFQRHLAGAWLFTETGWQVTGVSLPPFPLFPPCSNPSHAVRCFVASAPLSPCRFWRPCGP